MEMNTRLQKFVDEHLFECEVKKQHPIMNQYLLPFLREHGQRLFKLRIAKPYFLGGQFIDGSSAS